MSVQLDPKRVSCISGNLWRGNFPLKGRAVDFDGLDLLLGSASCGTAEICLTDNAGEADVLEILESTYDCKFTRELPPFNSKGWDPMQFHQKPGTNRYLYWWPIEGGSTPDVTGPGGYNFKGLVAFIAQILKESPRKVYVHCMNGTDRTGAVAAAYAIRYMGANLDDAIAWSARTNAGRMSQPYVDLVTTFSKA